jgi:hypothetical protein
MSSCDATQVYCGTNCEAELDYCRNTCALYMLHICTVCAVCCVLRSPVFAVVECSSVALCLLLVAPNNKTALFDTSVSVWCALDPPCYAAPPGQPHTVNGLLWADSVHLTPAATPWLCQHTSQRASPGSGTQGYRKYPRQLKLYVFTRRWSAGEPISSRYHTVVPTRVVSGADVCLTLPWTD